MFREVCSMRWSDAQNGRPRARARASGVPLLRFLLAFGRARAEGGPLSHWSHAKTSPGWNIPRYISLARVRRLCPASPSRTSPQGLSRDRNPPRIAQHCHIRWSTHKMMNQHSTMQGAALGAPGRLNRPGTREDESARLRTRTGPGPRSAPRGPFTGFVDLGPRQSPHPGQGPSRRSKLSTSPLRPQRQSRSFFSGTEGPLPLRHPGSRSRRPPNTLRNARSRSQRPPHAHLHEINSLSRSPLLPSALWSTRTTRLFRCERLTRRLFRPLRLLHRHFPLPGRPPTMTRKWKHRGMELRSPAT